MRRKAREEEEKRQRKAKSEQEEAIRHKIAQVCHCHSDSKYRKSMLNLGNVVAKAPS